MLFRSLRYFIAVYEELSFSGASKRCFVAQPSISSAMQQLENELDCQLFVRHAKGVTPTPAAEALYPKACDVLSRVSDIKTLARKTVTKVPLRLALSPFLGSERVSEIVKTLLDSVSGLELTLVDIDEPCDVRILSVSQVSENEVFKRLWVDHYVLALPEDHPLAALKTIPIEALNNVSFISRKPCDINELWNFTVQEKSLELNVRATVKTEEYSLDLVAAGLGVSLVPYHSAQSRQDIAIRPVADIKLERVIGFAYPKQHALSADILQAIYTAKQLLTQ